MYHFEKEHKIMVLKLNLQHKNIDKYTICSNTRQKNDKGVHPSQVTSPGLASNSGPLSLSAQI